jgi:hypothetical protein
MKTNPQSESEAMLSTVRRAAKSPKSSLPLPQEVKALAVVLRDEFDAPFLLCDATTGDRIVVPGQEEAARTIGSREQGATTELIGHERPKVVELTGGRYLIGFPMAAFGHSHLAALGVVPALARTPAEAVRELARLTKWSRCVHDRLVAARGLRDRERGQAEQDRQAMIAWEAMIALERLHRGTKIHKESTRERQRVLRAAGELLGAQSLVWGADPAGRRGGVRGRADPLPLGLRPARRHPGGPYPLGRVGLCVDQ